MKIGFTGPSRSGKTTLAKRVAEELGYSFLESPVSELTSLLKLNWLDDQDIIQRELAYVFYTRESVTPGDSVFDRTLADVLAYNTFIPDLDNCVNLTEHIINRRSFLNICFVCAPLGKSPKISGMFVDFHTFFLAAKLVYPDVVVVPVSPVEQRVQLVLKHVEKLCERSRT